jgi:LacI family transcriptional regulator
MSPETVQTIRTTKTYPIVQSGNRVGVRQALESLDAMCDTLLPGDRLPTHSELVRQLQMPERAVLAALKELHRVGRGKRIHGSGTYVTGDGRQSGTPTQSKPSQSAALRTIVALARPDNSFYDRSVQRLSVHVGIAGLDLVVRPVPEDKDLASFADDLEQAAGFIVFSAQLVEIARRLWHRGERVVNVGTPNAEAYVDVPTIYCDQEAGGYAVTQHLLKLGHRNIAFAYGDPSLLRDTLRWQGHMRAIVEGQLDGMRIAASTMDAQLVDKIERDGMAAKSYLGSPDAPTAIVAWNDMEAVKIIAALARHGLSVPGQVSVTGYDATAHGAVMHPSLTTVDNALDQQLRAAVDLLTRPTAPPATYTVVMQPLIITRESTAKLVRVDRLNL